MRYLVQLEGSWVYSICIIEGYSRKIVAGMASPHQDLTAILQILFAALALAAQSESGSPATTYRLPSSVIGVTGVDRGLPDFRPGTVNTAGPRFTPRR